MNAETDTAASTKRTSAESSEHSDPPSAVKKPRATKGRPPIPGERNQLERAQEEQQDSIAAALEKLTRSQESDVAVRKSQLEAVTAMTVERQRENDLKAREQHINALAKLAALDPNQYGDAFRNCLEEMAGVTRPPKSSHVDDE